MTPKYQQTQKSPPQIRRIRLCYVVFNLVSFFLGCGVIILAAFSRNFDSRLSGYLQMEIGKEVRILFYVVGGCIILNVILGFVAYFKEKTPYLWMIYCITLAALSLLLFMSSGLAFSLQVTTVRERMFAMMRNYGDESRKNIIDYTTIRLVDRFQKDHHCCGVDGFKDWQDVEFGRTSLKVPKSCCKLKSQLGKAMSQYSRQSSLSAEDLTKYESCGELCLPGHVGVENFLYTTGCYLNIFGSMEIYIAAMAWCGFILGTIFAAGFLLTGYLIAVKKI